MRGAHHLVPLLAVAVAQAGAGCSLGASPEESAVVVGSAADALRLDPALVTDAESAEVCEQIFDHLTRFKRDSMETEPSLARSNFHVPTLVHGPNGPSTLTSILTLVKR